MNSGDLGVSFRLVVLLMLVCNVSLWLRVVLVCRLMMVSVGMIWGGWLVMVDVRCRLFCVVMLFFVC